MTATQTKKRNTLRRRIDDAAADAFIRTVAALSAEPQYDVDAQGHKVRVFTHTRTPEEVSEGVREALLNQRGVDKREMLEAIGRSDFNFLVKTGYLVKDSVYDFYHVTRRAAEKYRLPRVNGLSFIDL